VKSRKSKGRTVLAVIAVILLAFVTITALVGSIRQENARKDEASYEWDGQFYMVGDHQMYAEVNGPADGIPVVFVSGLADGVYSWCSYAPTIEDSYRTITYDPSGIGQSEASKGTSDPDAEILDLHGLLEATGVEGPYVLVGHSRGGAIVRRYAQLFPDEIRGVVLVDATNEEMISDTLSRIAYQANKVQYDLLSVTNLFGLPRLLNDMGSGLMDREIDDGILAAKGADYLSAINEMCYRSEYISAVARQFGTVQTILDSVKKADQSLKIPAYVLYEVSTNDPDSPVEDTEEMLSRCIAAVTKQFPDIKSQIIYDAGHYIHFTRPEEVSAGIDWVVSEYQNNH
jgi:pimeloyl-ACP methyl ester carboxylesterase